MFKANTLHHDRGILAQAGGLVARLAQEPQDIEAAQRLRWAVFAEEMGANLPVTPHGSGLDCDDLDPYCLHLIVEDTGTGAVVGTYRILLPEQAKRAGRLYTEGEFDITALQPLRPELVELGRSCVHADYRNGLAIRLLWAGLGELLKPRPERYLLGCVSVSMADGGLFAASLWRHLWAEHAAAPTWRVNPKRPLPVAQLAHDCPVMIPPLVKGYLRAGSTLLGLPHVDAAFGCADFPMMLCLEQLTTRYARRFIRESGPRAEVDGLSP